MAEALLYKQHRTYTRELHDVHLHGNHKLHVICTSKGKGMDKMLSTFRSKLDGMPVKLVGVDVEYTHYVKPQRAAVLQLCVEKECLAYHISAAKDRPMELDKFLMNGEYTFVGFAIEGDKSKLKFFQQQDARNPQSHTPKIDREATRCDGLAYACGAVARRVAACSGLLQPRPRRGMGRGARPRKGLGREGHDPPPHPLLGLALMHAVRLSTIGRAQPQSHTPKIDREATRHSVFPTNRMHTTPEHTPKIDKEAIGCDGLSYACGAAARRIAACSGSFQARPRRGLGTGGHDPPPHPLLGLALTHEAQCGHSVFPRIERAQPQSHTPKIDREMTRCDGLAYACGAAARRVTACSGSFQARPRMVLGRGETTRCDRLAYACGAAARRVAACSGSFQARPRRGLGRGGRRWGVTDSPMHAAPRHAVSPPALARFRLDLGGVWGGGS
uniref:3'-5' exonuclease domain-containing protein n=1 Tax=Triticum aestivum TaxID=4565 RepID=A0A077RSC2_WHEAT|nr:unnamed protein product [Triticum aestivum]